MGIFQSRGDEAIPCYLGIIMRGDCFVGPAGNPPGKASSQ
jgi:hypothetical protein